MLDVFVQVFRTVQNAASAGRATRLRAGYMPAVFSRDLIFMALRVCIFSSFSQIRARRLYKTRENIIKKKKNNIVLCENAYFFGFREYSTR